MEWEKKFQSIVKETDANLAKVKMTLGKGTHSPAAGFPSSNWLPAKFSPLVRKPVLAELTSPSSLRQYSGTTTGISSLSPLTQSIRSSDTAYRPLEEKLELQNKAIDQLTRVVQRLERERDQYRDHITELQGQVRQVSSRLSDSYQESANDRRVEQWRREIMMELDSLRSQLRSRHPHTSSGHEYTDGQMFQHSKDLLELHRHMREDTESLRKDMDVLRDRIGKLELSVSENGMQREIINRMSDRTGISKLHKSRPPDVNWYTADNSLGKSEVAALKSNVSCLEQKVDAMETLMRSSGRSGTDEEARKRRQDRLSSVDIFSDDGSLDLADFESSEFSLGYKPKPRQEPLVYDSDEELDLNDLDLSDDKEDLSDDDDVLTIDDM